MASIVFNVAKGKIAQLATLPLANDAFVIIPVEASGLVVDEVMKDCATLGEILAGPSNEQVTMGRKVLTGLVVNVNHSDDRIEVDADDVTWGAASGNPVGAAVICYDPDTTSGTDADLVPLVKLDFVSSPGGGDLTLGFSPGGFYYAT